MLGVSQALRPHRFVDKKRQFELGKQLFKPDTDETLRLKAPQKALDADLPKPYFTDCTQSVHGQEICHLLRKSRIEVQSNISYLPDKTQFIQRLLRSLQNRHIHQVPPGWPKIMRGNLVWQASRLKEREYIYSLTSAELEEVDGALAFFKGIPWSGVTPSTFPLPTLGITLLAVRDVIYDGIGFQVLRGLDVDKYDSEDRATIFLALSRHIAVDCGAQDRRGTMLKHIIEDHKIESQNDLPFHTDVVCDVISLLTVHCSDHGGVSTIAPAWAVYNELAATMPHVIHTLMKDDWPFDTFGRDPPYYLRAPLYFIDGKIIFNFSRRLLAGHPVKGRSPGVPRLSEAQAEAIDAVHFAAGKLQLKIPMQRGDVRFINNLGLLHGRELYHDLEMSAESKRHVLRLWLRNRDMQWSLHPSLRVAWARIFDDPQRRVRWNPEPVFEDGEWQGSKLLSECD